MAMICINLNRECDGCMRCHDRGHPVCPVCGDEGTMDEYVVGVYTCDDCGHVWEED